MAALAEAPIVVRLEYPSVTKKRRRLVADKQVLKRERNLNARIFREHLAPRIVTSIRTIGQGELNELVYPEGSDISITVPSVQEIKVEKQSDVSTQRRARRARVKHKEIQEAVSSDAMQEVVDIAQVELRDDVIVREHPGDMAHSPLFDFLMTLETPEQREAVIRMKWRREGLVA